MHRNVREVNKFCVHPTVNIFLQDIKFSCTCTQVGMQKNIARIANVIL